MKSKQEPSLCRAGPGLSDGSLLRDPAGQREGTTAQGPATGSRRGFTVPSACVGEDLRSKRNPHANTLFAKAECTFTMTLCKKRISAFLKKKKGPNTCDINIM